MESALRVGQKLGYVLQDEVAALKHRLAQLEERLRGSVFRGDDFDA